MSIHDTKPVTKEWVRANGYMLRKCDKCTDGEMTYFKARVQGYDGCRFECSCGQHFGTMYKPTDPEIKKMIRGEGK